MSLVEALGLPPDAMPLLVAAGVVVGSLLLWVLSKPPVPRAKKPYGVLKDEVLWRSSAVGKFVETPEEGVTHVWEAIERTVRRFPDKPGVGQRPLLKRDLESDPSNPGKQFEKLSFGDYEWLTFGQMHKRASDFAAGLVAFGKLQPKGRVVIYGETQRDWMIAALAAFRQDVSVVTIYATLGEDGVVHGINQTKASVVVADAKLLPVLAAAASKCKTLKHVVSISPDMDPAQKAQLDKCGVDVISMDDACALGAKNPVAPASVTSSDIAVIMYTSGTTGLPKGVLITHGNFMAGVAGIKEMLGKFITPSDVYCAYLPLAHIMEMMVEVTNMFFGVSIGYGSPHTLTSTGVKLQKGQVGDAQLLKPTLMVFAPAVLDKVYKGVKARVDGMPPTTKTLFNMALQAGYRNFDNGGVGAGLFWNRLVFKKIQANLGGRIRAMLTGSAPLSAEVQRFVQTCFNAPVRQGYGLTETCAASCVAFLGDNSLSSVGPPSASACIRLRDWPEGGYLFSDKDKKDVGMPRGEVLIGGPMVTPGYLVDDQHPDEDVIKKNETEYVTINGVRYFCTGDVGQITKDGNLMIIDRKKDLVKLQQGEYVALSKVENALKRSEYVDLPMVYAKSTHSYCIALVCPALPALTSFAKSQGLPEDDIEALCSNDKVIKVRRARGSRPRAWVVGKGLLTADGPSQCVVRLDPAGGEQVVPRGLQGGQAHGL